MKNIFLILLLSAALNRVSGQLVADAGADQTMCIAGAVTIGGNPTATNGTGPFTYDWAPITSLSCNTCANPLASPASSTNYRVIVTDNLGAADTDYVMVTVYQLHLSSLSSFSPTCYGLSNGSVTMTGDCGTPPYSYSIDGGLTFQSSGTFQNLLAGAYHVVLQDAATTTYNDSFTLTQPALFHLDTVVATNVSCFGGSDGGICLTPTGGTGGATVYVWGGGPASGPCPGNLSAGTYSVTLTDTAGCSATASATVGQPAPLVVDSAVTTFGCAGSTGGSVCVHVSGGTQPYQYIWMLNGTAGACINNLLPGTYAVTITDWHACTTTAAANINAFPPPALSITTTNALCYGDTGSITVYIPAGNGPFIFEWSNGDSVQTLYNAVTGTYSVTVTDINHCSSSVSGSINQPSQLVVQINSATGGPLPDTLCVTAAGGTPPYSYAWNNPNVLPNGCLEITSTGLYSISVTDANACVAVATNNAPCPNECVWPGDADYNGLVDNYDLLPIGLAYATTGPSRPAQDINWSAHVSSAWTATVFVDSTNRNDKHSDCNGDGIVDGSDSLAILQNFSMIHAKNDDVPPWRMNIPALYVDLSPDTTHAGDTMYAYLSLGDVNTPGTNVYGLAFTLNYDIAVVDSNKTQAEFGNSWLGTAVDKISIAKDLKQGQLKCALTRIDHSTRSGSGQIGLATFVVTTDNINGKNLAYYSNHVWISDVRAIDNHGNYLSVNGGQDSTLVEFEPTGIAETGISNAEFKIQPNPANDFTTVSVSRELLGSNLRIIDLNGRIMSEIKISTTKFQLPTLSLCNGIYMLQALTSRESLTRRLVVAR